LKHICAQQVICDLPGVFCRFLRPGKTIKNFLKKFQKDGVQRAAKGLSGVMLAERDRTTTSPTERG